MVRRGIEKNQKKKAQKTPAPQAPLASSSSAPPAKLPGAAYWRKLNPALHCGDSAYVARASASVMQLPADTLASLKDRMRDEGFFTLEDLPWPPALVRSLRVGVRRLLKRGWPATLLLVYDEAWVMAHQISALMAAVSGGCANSLDTLAWSVTPSLGETGFAPHRDRQPADVPASFRADGTPRYATCWVRALARDDGQLALYLVPRARDHIATTPATTTAPTRRIRCSRSSARRTRPCRACARATSLKPGGCVIFTHRAMHWGSIGQPACERPRVSISFGHSDPSFEAPFLRDTASQLPYPPVKVRVALAAAQLINYHERFAFGVPLLRRLGATFKARKKAFTPEYAEKTAAEFMAACHDKRRSDDAREGGGAGGGDDSDDDDDDALDDALEAMLDAQANATGNLYDDS